MLSLMKPRSATSSRRAADSVPRLEVKRVVALLSLCLLADAAWAAGPGGKWPHAPAPCSAADAILTTKDFANNFAALDAALEKALANPGSDGVATVVIPPGAYPLKYADRGAFSVSARGRDVELCGQGGIASFTMADGYHRYVIPMLGKTRVLNMEMSGAWVGIPSATSFEIINTRIADTSSECLFWSEQTTNGYGYVANSEFDGCRASNQTGHSMYLSNRSCVFVATNNTFRAQSSLEVWRSLCRFNYFADNYISNVRDVTKPVIGKVAAAVDFPSCGLTVFARNRIEVAGNVPAVLSRQRRSISGCDLPGQAEQGDTGIADVAVWSTDLWRGVRAGPVPTDAGATADQLLNNRALFPLILWANELVNVTGSTSAAVFLYSSAAMDNEGTGSIADSEYLRVPSEWTERHFGVAVGNSITGWSGGTWRGQLNAAVDPTTHPDVKEWVTRVLRPTLLPRGFTLTSPPPAWMPATRNARAVCEYFAARYKWAEPGFPSCAGLPVAPGPAKVRDTR